MRHRNTNTRVRLPLVTALACWAFSAAAQTVTPARPMELQQTRYELRQGEHIQISASTDTLNFLFTAKSRSVAIGSAPAQGLVVGLDRAGEVVLGASLRAKPGEYAVSLSATSAAGEVRQAALTVVVDALTTVPLGSSRPPVVLLNGWETGFTGTCPISNSSSDTFGNLASYLVSDGVPVVYLFDNCLEDPYQTVETLGNDLSAFLNSIQYTNGTQVPQIDLVGFSLGGLIARAYLAGLQPNETLLPPFPTLVRKLVLIASPNFGSFVAGDYIASIEIGTQDAELIPASSLLWNLATWNQQSDDLRGVSAIGVIGNAGIYVPSLTAGVGNNNASDGIVSTSSATAGFVYGQSVVTRIVPYCHIDPSAFINTTFGVFECNAPGIANVTSTTQETGEIVRSFLSGTTAWQSIGSSTSSDAYLSQYGGMFFALVSSTGSYVSDISSVTWGTVPLQMGGDTDTIFYYDLIKGTGTFEYVSASLGTGQGCTQTAPVGYSVPVRCKVNSTITSVTPLLSTAAGRVVGTGAITINGADFGTACSGCQVIATPAGATTGQILPVSSWTATAIKATLPASLTGLLTITVTAVPGTDSIAIIAASPTPSTIAAAPASLAFSYTAGGAAPASQSIQITNSGAGTLAWTATASASWLSISPASGTAPSALSVSISPTGLAAGTYNGNVSIASTGASNTPLTVAVTLTVTVTPNLAISPATLTFGYTLGGAVPAAQTISITNTGGGTLAWSASTSASWLALSPTSGAAPGTLSVSLNPAGLAAGSYTGGVQITAVGAAGSPASIAVTLAVQAPPTLVIAPASLTFSYATGGAVPAAQTVSITNTGGGTLAWTASSSVYWLTLSPASGGAPGTLSVSLNPANLAAGTYTGAVQITAPGATGSPASIAVTLVVTGTLPAPSLMSVANGGSFQPGGASATWISIFGTNLSTVTYQWQASDFVNGLLPASLQGVSVSINGLRGYIYYLSPTQINVLAPDDPTLGPVPVTVTIGQQTSNSLTLQKSQFAPSLFTIDNGKYAAALSLSYVLIGSPGLLPGVTTMPAQPGETIVIYGTGFGPANPPLPTAQLVTTPSLVANTVQMTMGGVTAPVTYAGLVGPGLYQFNVTVPSLPNGDAAVLATIGGVSTQTGVSVTVQQ
jgi:uncharacterized protein (TIGR03437 family)